MTDASEITRADPISEKAVVSDTDETVWQNMESKAPQKFACIERELLLSVVIAVVLIGEAYGLAVERAETVLRESDAVGVSGQIRKDLCWTPKGSFCIDDPIESAGLLEERRTIKVRRTLAKRRVLPQLLAK